MLAMYSVPLVSVVMPSLNQRGFIEAAIESVLSQEYPNIELVVVDGGSRDGTHELLARRAKDDTRIRWISEADKGPASAVNKGFKMARGTIIGWLNSDDLYTTGAIARAVNAFVTHPTWLMVYGHGEHIDIEGRPLGIYPTLPPATALDRFREGCFICQPTVFFRRSMWLMLGDLDENLAAAFDFEFWIRMFLSFQGRIGFVDERQACSRLHGECITRRQRRAVAMEGMLVLARHFGSAPREWLLTYVNEALAEPSLEEGVDDLRQHFVDAAATARPWLTAADYQALKDEIASLLADRVVRHAPEGTADRPQLRAVSIARMAKERSA